MAIDAFDDNLDRFAAEGLELPSDPDRSGYVAHDGAEIWFASLGEGPVVVLLHGGLGHSGNFGFQVPALVSEGFRVISVDTRGHGRSTRDDRPYSYELLAKDLLAVLEELQIGQASLIGWSDGACIALILADKEPSRVEKVFFFACNMDPSGTKDMEHSKALGNCFSRHSKDYAALSQTPGNFQQFVDDVSKMMDSEPNYTADDLKRIQVPVTVALGEGDEFIKLEHAAYLANTLPKAELRILPEVTHFAPLQRPEEFNAELLRFLHNG